MRIIRTITVMPLFLVLAAMGCTSVTNKGALDSQPRSYKDALRLTLQGRGWDHVHINSVRDTPAETWQQKFDALSAEINRQYPEYPRVHFLLQKQIAQTVVPGWKGEPSDACWFDAYLDGYRIMHLVCDMMNWDFILLDNGVHISVKKATQTQAGQPAHAGDGSTCAR